MTGAVQQGRWQWWGIALVVLLGGAALGLWQEWDRLFPAPLAQGLAAYGRGDWRAASSRALERLQAEKDDTEALRLLARSSAQLGRDASAVSLFQRIGPKAMKAEDHYLLGLALSRNGQVDSALKAWESVLSADPNHAEALEKLAHLYARLGQLEKANEAAERLARLPGWKARAELLLGVLRYDLNDPAGAAEMLASALRRDPKSGAAAAGEARFRKLLARALLQTGQYAEARDQLQSVLASGPDGETFWLLSRAELQAGAKDQAATALAQAGSYRADNPLEPEPSPYVGAARCEKCHRTLTTAMLASRHTRSYHHGDALKDLPVPEHSLPDPGDPQIVHTIERAGDQIRVETRLKDEIVHSLVEYAFGTRDRYLTMVGRDDRGDYRALRVSYYHAAGKSGWDLTMGDVLHPPRVDEYSGKPMEVREGAIRCLFCHTTNVRSGRVRTGPETADRGVGCERCHGPGGHHLAAIALEFPDLAIVNPALGSSEAITTKACGQCHNLNEPEMELDKPRTDPVWIRSPSKSLTWSRCYTESNGTLNCLSCHAPHRPLETSAAYYEDKCLSCHSSTSPVRASTSETPAKVFGTRSATPCPVNPAKDCLSCHMPRVPIELLHMPLTDHYIRVRLSSTSLGSTPREQAGSME